jgi:CheY-like chemotaxis protein
VSDPSYIDVLVVDDDVDLRSIVAEILSEEGYSVATAWNGLDALETLARVRASLILLDLMMPEMDGWEFRRRQLAAPELAAIPVVVFTAHANVAEAAATMSAAAGLQKPVDVGGLLAVVERVLDRARRGGASPRP